MLVVIFSIFQPPAFKDRHTIVYYSLTSTYIDVKTAMYDRNILVKNYERLELINKTTLHNKYPQIICTPIKMLPPPTMSSPRPATQVVGCFPYLEPQIRTTADMVSRNNGAEKLAAWQNEFCKVSSMAAWQNEFGKVSSLAAWQDEIRKLAAWQYGRMKYHLTSVVRRTKDKNVTLK